MNGAMGELSLCKGRLGVLQDSARRRWTKTVRDAPPQQSCKDLEATGSPKNYVAVVNLSKIYPVSSPPCNQEG